MQTSNSYSSMNSATLSLLTFNILAPCYKRIPVNDTNTNEYSNSVSTSTNEEYIFESDLQEAYMKRMEGIFKLLGKLSRNPYLVADRIESSPITPFSYFSCSPLNLLFIQEFWFDERHNSQVESITNSADCKTNNRTYFSEFFEKMFKLYLGDYEFYGTQRLLSKADGVLVGFYRGPDVDDKDKYLSTPNIHMNQVQYKNDGEVPEGVYNTNGVFNRFDFQRTSPWEMIDRKSFQLYVDSRNSGRVATLTHFKSKQKFMVRNFDGEKPLVEHIHVMAVCTHLTFPHTPYDEKNVRVDQTKNILQYIHDSWNNFDPNNSIHPCFKYSIIGGDLNVPSKLRHNPKEDAVLSYLYSQGYESIFQFNDFISHLNHNGEEAPADFFFVNRKVIVKESFLIPKDKPHNKWDDDWSKFSDHRPLLACIELNPEVSYQQLVAKYK